MILEKEKFERLYSKVEVKVEKVSRNYGKKKVRVIGDSPKAYYSTPAVKYMKPKRRPKKGGKATSKELRKRISVKKMINSVHSQSKFPEIKELESTTPKRSKVKSPEEILLTEKDEKKRKKAIREISNTIF